MPIRIEKKLKLCRRKGRPQLETAQRSARFSEQKRLSPKPSTSSASPLVASEPGERHDMIGSETQTPLRLLADGKPHTCYPHSTSERIRVVLDCGAFRTVSCSRPSLSFHREQPPAGILVQHARMTLSETNARPGHEPLHGIRHEHLARSRTGGDL